MSSAPTPPAPSSAPPPGSPPRKREITLISHSMLFYWWPIWVLGFVMAMITYSDNTRLAIVPAGSKVTQITTDAEKQQNTTVYRLAVPNPPTASLTKAEEATTSPGDEPTFKPRISQRP